jgi:hypothetical protein
MSKNPSDAHNVESLQKQVKKLKKQQQSHDPEGIALLRASNPALAHLSDEDVCAQQLHQYDFQASVAFNSGFSDWNTMVAYAKGRPRREEGGIVISERTDLTPLQALNERAKLHDMPLIGSTMINQYGIEWVIASYDFFRTPTTVARYPGDCDYLPIVYPHNASERLKDFMSETDRCTSKRIVFVDTMLSKHPFKQDASIHFASYGADPEESVIYLNATQAHETTFAHELAHLWLIYVEGGDDYRILRDRSNSSKVNQLDFLQSFVLDLKVNDLIEARGFDMSLINNDQINALIALKDSINLGLYAEIIGEALLYTLSIAAAVLEQKRWPNHMKQDLSNMLSLFEANIPQIYTVAMQFVAIVRRHGYDTHEAIKKVLDECIILGFHATGDDLDLERDLQEVTTNECMQDKYPDYLSGVPVQLKLEISKTMARHGINGECQIWLSISSMGMAQIIVEDANGVKIGPFSVNFQLIPEHLIFDYTHLQRPKQWWEGANTADEITTRSQEMFGPKSLSNPFSTAVLVNGMIPDDFGRLPGDPLYNTCFPSDHDPFNSVTTSTFNGQILINGQAPDQFGRLPGHPQYNTCTPRKHNLMGSAYAANPQLSQATMAALQRAPVQPWSNNPNHPAMSHQGHNPQTGFGPVSKPKRLPHHLPPLLPNPSSTTDVTRRYMAGVGLSVARARLAKQIELNNGLDTNLYEYAYNNPVTYIDPSGDVPLMAKSVYAPRARNCNAVCNSLKLKYVRAVQGSNLPEACKKTIFGGRVPEDCRDLCKENCNSGVGLLDLWPKDEGKCNPKEVGQNICNIPDPPDPPCGC